MQRTDLKIHHIIRHKACINKYTKLSFFFIAKQKPTLYAYHNVLFIHLLMESADSDP